MNIFQGATQRKTAEIIYHHLIAHPDDVPTTGAHHLVFRLDGDGAAGVEFRYFDATVLGVRPVSANEIQVERNWAANYHDDMGREVWVSNPHTDRYCDHRENIRLIRLIVGRAKRYHAKAKAASRHA